MEVHFWFWAHCAAAKKDLCQIAMAGNYVILQTMYPLLGLERVETYIIYTLQHSHVALTRFKGKKAVQAVQRRFMHKE